MISLLNDNYNFLNILLVCINLILPLLFYIIAFVCISENQEKWFAELHFNAGKLVNDRSSMFISCIVFFLVGIASLIIGDYYYRAKTNKNCVLKRGAFKVWANPIQYQNFHFYLFPIVILLSVLGLPIMFQTHNLLPHGIMSVISSVGTLYLIIFYINITWVISALLLPFLAWQIYNSVVFLMSTQD